MSKPTKPDFARLASDYDRVRPVDDNWREVFELVVDEAELRGRRILDCGCGTGRLSRALAEDERARVWGVDVEPTMLAVARASVPAGVGLKEGRAEDLPFRDASFERAVLWLVCHLVDRPKAFAELRRILVDDGRLVVVTFDPDHFSDFWLNTFFPSLERIDRARFPTRAQLETELVGGGFPRTSASSAARNVRRSHGRMRSSGSASATFRRSTSSTRTRCAQARSGPRRSCRRRSNMGSNG